jgi:Flp pilus assembly pilin Flp
MKTRKSLEIRKRRSLARDQKGGTDFVELLIMVALIAFVVIAGVQTFGQSVMDKFTEQSGNVDGI